MGDYPSINHVAILGVIENIQPKPDSIFCWQFRVNVVASSQKLEASLLCGVGNNALGDMVQAAAVGRDWVVIAGKVREKGFIQVRELSVFPGSDGISHVQLPIHHVGLMGQIQSINYNTKTKSPYVWQFDLAIYPEYGGDDFETVLTCGMGGDSSFYNAMLEKASEGKWASVQGKVRNGGFIQIRSMSVFDVSANQK